jgi:hypothetical protein
MKSITLTFAIIIFFIGCKKIDNTTPITPSLPSLNAFTSAGGNGEDLANSITTDAAGNVYITGYFSGSVSFGDTYITSTSNSKDIFVAKYNKSGALSWVKTGGGGFGTDAGTGIAVDNVGNVFITGLFYGKAYFAGNEVNAINNHTPAYFIAKYNTNGTLQWIKPLVSTEGPVESKSGGITVDKIGNVYVTNVYYGSLTLGNNTIATSGVGNYDAYITKFSSDGNCQWLRSMGPIRFSDVSKSVVADDLGNVYIIGNTSQSFQIGNVTTTKKFGFSQNSLVVKYDNNGNILWVKTLEASDGGIGVKDIIIDSSGNICIVGDYGGAISLGSTTLKYSLSQDIFIAKYSKNGMLQSTLTLGENPYNYLSASYCLDVDDLGNTYVVGSHEKYAGSDKDLLPKGFFVAKYTVRNTLEWIKPIDETNDYMGVYDIKVTGLDDILLTGYYLGNIALDNNNSINSNGNSDIFVLRIKK